TVPDSSGGVVGPARHRVPDRPTAPPVVAAPDEQPPTLDATAPSEPDGRTSRGSRGLTRRSAVLGTVLAVLATGSLLTWSLTRDDDPRGGGAGGSGSAASSVTVRIGVDAPLSGGLASMGTGIRNSAELAVRTANETGHVPGVTFELTALDDGADPAKGAANATRFVSDDKLVGVVGPLNSGVARTLVPVLSRAGVVNVSPGNTDPALTLGPDWATGTRARPYSTYFRTVGTDADQGPFAARYLYSAGKTKIYVVDDASPHGTAVASGLTAAWKRLGGTVVGTERVDPAERDFAGLALRVRSSGAEAVYFGGYYDTAAPLSQQLKQAGVTVPLMGGDGIFDQAYLTGNPRADGDLATQIGAPAEESAAGRDFLSRYEKAGYAQPPGWYGPYAYDATWALIEAVKDLAKSNGGTLPGDTRAKLPRAVEHLAFDGVTGPVAFDGGDAVDRRLTVYQVDDGSWQVRTTSSSAP
ncbi:branched-chain amino acid ABC transporter substrate-binding protein, partial [Streptomyces hydrogenans]